jgi:hypothetical protein
MRWVRHITHVGEMRTANSIFVGKPEGKRLLGRPRHKWEDNILKEIGWEGVDCMYLVQDRDQWWALVNVVLNLWVP